MFEVGDKIVCIHNGPLDSNWFSIDKDFCLTRHKEYTVILKKSATTISIINDNGFQQPFANSRFVSLGEFRKMKILKLKNGI